MGEPVPCLSPCCWCWLAMFGIFWFTFDHASPRSLPSCYLVGSLCSGASKCPLFVRTLVILMIRIIRTLFCPLALIHERKRTHRMHQTGHPVILFFSFFFFNFKAFQQLFLTEANLEQQNLLAFCHFPNKEIVSKTKLIKLPFMKLLKINVQIRPASQVKEQK